VINNELVFDNKHNILIGCPKLVLDLLNKNKKELHCYKIAGVIVDEIDEVFSKKTDQFNHIITLLDSQREEDKNVDEEQEKDENENEEISNVNQKSKNSNHCNIKKNKHPKSNYQKIVTSATMPGNIEDIVKRWSESFVFVKVGSMNTINSNIKHIVK